jgi:transcriptional regulator with XRE-family HTH domain
MNFGSYLKNAREGRHLTLDEISAVTKIKRTLLADLEANDISRWPKHRIYRHGYLHSYAKALGVTPGELIARFDDEFPDEHPVAFQPNTPAKPSPQQIQTTQKAAVVVAAGGLCLMLALTVLNTQSDAGATVNPMQYSRETESEVRPVLHELSPAPVGTALSSTVDVTPAVKDELLKDELLKVEGEVLKDDTLDVEGELQIVSSPPEAFVTVNGIGRGKTPVFVKYLPPGSYTIRAVHPDYKSAETRVMLSAERPNRTVKVVLQPTE